MLDRRSVRAVMLCLAACLCAAGVRAMGPPHAAQAAEQSFPASRAVRPGPSQAFGPLTFGPDLDARTIRPILRGPADLVRFEALRNDLACRRITVLFANGRERTVFSGRLFVGQPETMRVRANHPITRITYTCRSLGPRRARLATRIFTAPDRPGQGPGAARGLVRLGAERFGRRLEAERRFSRFSDPLSRIALQPVEENARCSRVGVTFRNGRTRALPFTGRILSEGRIYPVDLPGSQRHIRSISLVCRAVGARDVTIRILGDRRVRL